MAALSSAMTLRPARFSAFTQPAPPSSPPIGGKPYPGHDLFACPRREMGDPHSPLKSAHEDERSAITRTI